jgi:hypothetical protein
MFRTELASGPGYGWIRYTVFFKLSLAYKKTCTLSLVQAQMFYIRGNTVSSVSTVYIDTRSTGYVDTVLCFQAQRPYPPYPNKQTEKASTVFFTVEARQPSPDEDSAYIRY